MNPKIPLLYSLTKLHKNNSPIRPIISSIDSSTYRICKFLIQFFKNVINFKADYAITNRYELIETLKSLHLPKNFTLLSFDVTNLYTNVPVNETLNIAKHIIEEKVDSKNVEHIFNLLKICTEQNFCQFNDKFYQYNEGLPMGSPLSGLLSDIFLNSIENKILHKDNINNNNIVLWLRYVDDILIIWDDDGFNLIDDFHKYINNLHKNHKFTIEIEKHKQLNFLDLTLVNTDYSIQYKIYRKPTQTDTIIPYYSHHITTHKLAAFNAYLYRCFNTPLSNEDRNTEINIIKSIGINNGFQLSQIDKIINKL
nr:uncharacterized protein LOC111416729 [Onthophagus taurus]